MWVTTPNRAKETTMKFLTAALGLALCLAVGCEKQPVNATPDTATSTATPAETAAATAEPTAEPTATAEATAEPAATAEATAAPTAEPEAK